MAVYRKGFSRQSHGTREKTSYRKVITRLLAFADKEIRQLHPEWSRVDRIKEAHEEPWFNAAKELRNLTAEERQQVGLTK